MRFFAQHQTDPSRAGNSQGVQGVLVDQTPRVPDACVSISAIPNEATRAVYVAHADYVWRTLQRMGVGRDDRDDAFQDVFLVVQRRIGSFRAGDPLKPWLFTICHNVVNHRRRSDERTRRRLARFEVDPPARGDVIRTPEEAAMAGEAVLLVEAFLAELDSDRRWIFHLAEIEGLTAPEIAAALDTNVNTVYTRLRAARAAFASFLSQRGAGEVAS